MFRVHLWQIHMQCVPGSPGFSCVCGVWVLGYVHPQPLNPPPVLDSTAVMCSVLRSTYSRHRVHTQYTSKKTWYKYHTYSTRQKNISTSIPFENGTERYGRACAIERSRKKILVKKDPPAHSSGVKRLQRK